MDFTWNIDKAQSNLNKHGVSFDEAVTVFNDPLAITYSDPDHSVGEMRFLTFGLSGFNRRLLVVSHLDTMNSIRIISARVATKQEQRIYENDG